jgi:hypothetical protein
MIKSYLSIIIFTAITILFYLGVCNRILTIQIIYYLPLIWLFIYSLTVKIWQPNRIKYLIAIHILILFIGLFSFILYQLYLKLEKYWAVNDYSQLSKSIGDLMFRSADCLYVMVYLLVVVFFIDLIYFINRYRKAN